MIQYAKTKQTAIETLLEDESRLFFNKRDFSKSKNETYCLIDYHCYPLYTVNGDNMNLSAYIKQQGISVYSLSKKSAVSYCHYSKEMVKNLNEL